MIGAIAGDIIGSVHEGTLAKRKDFPLFVPQSCFTEVLHALDVSSGDLPTRFTALHLWYHLFEAAEGRDTGTFEPEISINNCPDLDDYLRYVLPTLSARLKDELSLLVSHLPVDRVARDWRVFRWEISEQQRDW